MRQASGAGNGVGAGQKQMRATHAEADAGNPCFGKPQPPKKKINNKNNKDG